MSRFYVALDDDIMRIQGGEIVQRVMEMTNLPEDIPIEAALIGKSIETAQKRMEGMHFDARKTVVEYDDVVNQQREIFYSRRRRLLFEIEDAEKRVKDLQNNQLEGAFDNLKKVLWEKLESEVELVVSKHFIESREDSIDIKEVIAGFLDLANDSLISQGVEKLKLGNYINSYDALETLFSGKSQDEIIEIGKKIANEAFEIKLVEFGKDLPLVAKMLVFKTMDELWTDQLDAMKALRDGIGLRGFAQQDPLVEYKNEGFELFDNFITSIDSEIAKRILKVQKVLRQSLQSDDIRTNEDQVKEINTGSREILSSLKKFQGRREAQKTEPQKTVINTVQIGRNDPCPCGSGLKYKKCGMINAPSHKG